MKNNPLDDIIKCDVEISNPGSSDVSFDSILLVVAGPAAKGTATISGTTVISKADELLNYGYKTDSPAYIAATVAFYRTHLRMNCISLSVKRLLRKALMKMSMLRLQERIVKHHSMASTSRSSETVRILRLQRLGQRQTRSCTHLSTRTSTLVR